MWYEIFPTFAIFTTFVMLPMVAPYGISYVLNGRVCRRTAIYPEDRKFTSRDERLTGNYYKLLGLDDLPDEDSKK